jgi:hypothetical protein
MFFLILTWVDGDAIKEVAEQGGFHATEETGKAFLLCEGEDALDDGGFRGWRGRGGGGGRGIGGWEGGGGFLFLLCLCLGLDDIEGHDEGVGARAAHSTGEGEEEVGVEV